MTRKTEDCGPAKVVLKQTIDGTPRLGFQTKSELPANMEDTPEGFLLCHNVALARTGDQLYMHYEVPLEAGPDGTIVVERPESEVFRDATVESFRGKPFTFNHPTVDVSADNWRAHMVGTVMNPRRGEGDRNHCIIGDIIVYDPQTIKQIKSGVREVSAGYDANYQQIETGRGRQTDILANHVSLVPQGRCGPTCAIQDEKVSIMAKGKNFLDNLRAAFKARDEDAFEEAMEVAAKEGVENTNEPERPETEESEGGSNQHHVTVNIGGMTPDSMNAMRHDGKKARDEDPEGDTPPPDPMEMIKAAVTQALAPVVARLDSLEQALDESGDPDDSMTTDAIGRAEILKPGIKLPTFDAAPGSRKQRDAIVAFQRQTLSEAFNTKDGRAAIAPLVSGNRPNFATMDAAVVDVVFRGASERMRDANNARVSVALPTITTADGERKTFDNKTWNNKNKEFWARNR
jgi:hypothetical protein